MAIQTLYHWLHEPAFCVHCVLQYLSTNSSPPCGLFPTIKVCIYDMKTSWWVVRALIICNTCDKLAYFWLFLFIIIKIITEPRYFNLYIFGNYFPSMQILIFISFFRLTIVYFIFIYLSIYLPICSVSLKSLSKSLHVLMVASKKSYYYGNIVLLFLWLCFLIYNGCNFLLLYCLMIASS